MQILPIVFVAAVAILHIMPAVSQARRSEPLAVTAVADGETITIARYGRVRLLGIKAASFDARDRLSEMVLRRWVRLEHDGGAFDEHRRQAAYVFREDGLFVNAELVRAGLARVSARAPLSRLDELQRAEAEARRFHRGVWSSTPRAARPGYTREPAP